MGLSVDTLVAQWPVRFPELCDVSNEQVTLYVGDAVATHGLCDRAALYLAAHLYVLDRDQPDGGIDDGLGEITSDSIGKKSSIMKALAERGEDAFYTTTPYGRKYLHFRRKCAGRAFSVRVY